MKAYVTVKPGVIEVQERPKPQPGEGEVLLKVKCVGICGSDVHWFKHGRIGTNIMRKPTVLGHEFSAVVEETGDGVQGLEPGDKVVVEPGVPCGRCEWCFKGLYNLCLDMRFCGTPPADGVFQEYYVSPTRFVFPFERMSFEESALIEPVAVAVHTLQVCGMSPGESVIIFGCGAVGLMVIQVARALGASRIIGVDLVESRLKLAGHLGADLTVNSSRDSLSELADIVVECTGAPPVLDMCLRSAERNGRVAVLGIPSVDTLEIDAHIGRKRELTVHYVRRYRHCFAPAVELCERGAVKLRPLITHLFNIEELERALNFVADNPDKVVRAVVRVS